jgi:hypothetical protein
MFVGVVFWIKQLPIPFVGECNRDINLMCTFGTGLETAVIIWLIVLLVLTVMGLLGLTFPVFIVLSITTFPAFFFSGVATTAWLWNPLCQARAFLGLFGLLGVPFLTWPEFPVCAADQTWALLDKIFNSNTTPLVPAAFFVTSAGVPPATCADYIASPNCSGAGFADPLSGISYALQILAPPSVSQWLVGYVNTTALVRGDCALTLGIPLIVVFALFVGFGLNWILALLAVAAIGLGLTYGLGLHGICQGILFPLYSYNFQTANVTVLVNVTGNGTDFTNACFDVVGIPGMILTGAYLIVAIFAVWLALLVLLILVGLLAGVLALPPFSLLFDAGFLGTAASSALENYTPMTAAQALHNRIRARELDSKRREAHFNDLYRSMRDDMEQQRAEIDELKSILAQARSR